VIEKTAWPWVETVTGVDPAQATFTCRLRGAMVKVAAVMAAGTTKAWTPSKTPGPWPLSPLPWLSSCDVIVSPPGRARVTCSAVSGVRYAR
jgi:hypothetical protein